MKGNTPLFRFKKSNLVSGLLLVIIVLVSACDVSQFATAPELSGEPSSARTLGIQGRSKIDPQAIGPIENHDMRSIYRELYIDRSAGGTFQFANGRLDIQPNSINQSAVIWARTYFVKGSGLGTLIKNIYEFGPSGTTFTPAAILTLSYCNLGPIMPDSLDLMYYNEETGQWELAAHMVHDPTTRTFSGPISHFSRYSLSGNGQTLLPLLEQ